MVLNPLHQPCTHSATAEESQRDPAYMFCSAGPGSPCLWAKRFDGYLDPAFHIERLEAAVAGPQQQTWAQRQAFQQAVLETGLV